MRGATLNGAPWSVSHALEALEATATSTGMPMEGLWKVEFRSVRRPAEAQVALTWQEFHRIWTKCALNSGLLHALQSRSEPLCSWACMAPAQASKCFALPPPCPPLHLLLGLRHAYDSLAYGRRMNQPPRKGLLHGSGYSALLCKTALSQGTSAGGSHEHSNEVTTCTAKRAGLQRGMGVRRLTTSCRQAYDISAAWKLELLDTICQRYYLTAEQAAEVIGSFELGDEKVKAACRMFSRIVDLEDWHVAIQALNSVQQERLFEEIGMLNILNPKNPTGVYTLHLAYQLHLSVAMRLLEIYRLQVCYTATLHYRFKKDQAFSM